MGEEPRQLEGCIVSSTRPLHQNPALVLPCLPLPRCPIPPGTGEEESGEGVIVVGWVVEWKGDVAGGVWVLSEHVCSVVLLVLLVRRWIWMCLCLSSLPPFFSVIPLVCYGSYVACLVCGGRTPFPSRCR